MASFPSEEEVRAVIEGQMMARKMYMELRGMHIGTVFLFLTIQILQTQAVYFLKISIKLSTQNNMWK